MARTILLVEDDQSLRVALEALLRRAGYDVVLAVNGLHALSVAALNWIDGVLTDVDMPDMNGIELCRQLQKIGATTGGRCPTWIMTGNHTPEVVERGLAAGAIAVLAKPFYPREALQALEVYFSRSDSAEAQGADVPQTH